MIENIPNGWCLESILILTYFKGLSYSEQNRIINRYSSLDNFLSNANNYKTGNLFNSAESDLSIFKEKAKQQLDFIAENNINIITIWNEQYPDLLKTITSPPTILFVYGTLQQPNALSISVVGTRKCTQYGKLATDLFVSEFVRNNIITTSGLAYGIDSAAHQAAIRKGGITYAVIASGIDKISPLTSKKMADEIVASGGAILSEYKCGTNAAIQYFPQRNRIISGISQATLIAESASKGGSLITARFALDQGREVFAIPGNITAEKSRGCNELIHQNKAAVAYSPTAMLKDLGLMNIDFETNKSIEKITFNSQEEELIFNNLSLEPLHIDMLPQLTNLDISQILVLLLEMEFNGIVKQLPGKYYIKESI
jgi:DNA processing protein